MAPGGGVLLIVSRCAICDGSSELLERFAAKRAGLSAVRMAAAGIGSDKACATFPALLFDMMCSMDHSESPLLQTDASAALKGKNALWRCGSQLAAGKTLGCLALFKATTRLSALSAPWWTPITYRNSFAAHPACLDPSLGEPRRL